MPLLPSKRMTPRESCPDARFLCALAEARSTGSDRDDVATHVTECPECRELYSRLLAFAQPPVPLSEEEWAGTEKRLGNWMEAFLRAEESRTRQQAAMRPVSVSSARKWLGFSMPQWAASVATLAIAAIALAFFIHSPVRNRPVEVAVQKSPVAPQVPTVPNPSGTEAPANAGPQKELTTIPETHSEIQGPKTPPAESLYPTPARPPLSPLPKLTPEPKFPPAVLSPEVKQAIAEELQAEIGAERDATTSPQLASVSNDRQVPPVLAPGRRTFIVSHTVGGQTENGQECGLASGDVIARIGDVPDANEKVKMLVTSSETNDCPSGTVLAITVQDLQDMYNDFQEKLDTGLKMLADNEGKNGLPYGPTADAHLNPEGSAAPDLDAAADLRQQQIEANNKEDEVKQANGSVAPSAFHRNQRLPAAPFLLERTAVNSDAIFQTRPTGSGELHLAAWSQNSRQSEPHSQQSSRSTPPAPTKPPAAPAARPANPHPSAMPHQPVPKPSNPANGKATVPAQTRKLPSPHMGALPTNRAGSLSRGAGISRSTNGIVRELHTRSGAEAIFGPSGKITSIAFGGTTIRYAPNGVRRVETLRRDGTRVVSIGRNRGFVEYPFTQRGGRFYVSRTHVVNGHSYARVYTRYRYRAGYLYDYVPAYSYAPAFYGWAYNSWAAPIYYRGWNWNAEPWYGHYRYYFVPLPFYASPALWLTDFLFAENLKTAYEAQEELNRSAISGQSSPAPRILPNVPALDSRWSLIDQVTALFPRAASRPEPRNYWELYGIFADPTLLVLRPLASAANFGKTADA